MTDWLDRSAPSCRAELVAAFERAFNALWRRAHVTLGGVTLTAIVDRVVHSASESYPALATIVVGECGIRCENLATAAGVCDDEIRAALNLVLVDFLTVLGNLTAEILTPALHDELSRCNAGCTEAR